MKVGEYVRTNYGYIGKIVEESYSYDFEIEENGKLKKLKKIEGYIMDTNFMFDDELDRVDKKDIIKSSSNIIDLIEVGDYVNGLYVYKEALKDKRKKQIIWVDDSSYNECGECPLKNDEIKSIVTKEQFEQMEYKVGDKE